MRVKLTLSERNKKKIERSSAESEQTDAEREREAHSVHEHIVYECVRVACRRNCGPCALPTSDRALLVEDRHNATVTLFSIEGGYCEVGAGSIESGSVVVAGVGSCSSSGARGGESMMVVGSITGRADSVTVASAG